MDVDPNKQATMRLGRMALFSLDHIMVKTPGYREGLFTVHNAGGSDHLAISYRLPKNS